MSIEGPTVETFIEYSDLANKTAIYPDRGFRAGLEYTLLGLLGEAGELANKYKKVMRDGTPLRDFKEAMVDELGDVLWYVAMLAEECGSDLEMVAHRNIMKLLKRQREDKLKGSGDNR